MLVYRKQQQQHALMFIHEGFTNCIACGY